MEQRAGPQAAESAHVLGRPAGTASEAVRRYEAHSFAGLAPGFHRGLPSRALTFRFSLGEPTEIVSMPDAKQPPAKLFAFVGGLHSAPALVAHSGRGLGVGVDVSPMVARRLFGVPAGALGSLVVDLDDLWGERATAELCGRLHSAATWSERFCVLDEVIARVMASREPKSPPPEVAEAWRCITASKGRTPVAAIASHVGWSRRHLANRFTAEIGLSPKAAQRVIRFEWACEHLLRPNPPSLADVAATAGYYDQSHLTREWSELAGCSPTTWLAEEFHDPPRQDDDFPFIQDREARAG